MEEIDKERAAAIKDARWAQNKYRNFFEMCLCIRHHVIVGRKPKDTLILRNYADTYKCSHLLRSDLDKVVDADNFSFNDACRIRDIYSQREVVLKNSREKRKCDNVGKYAKSLFDEGSKPQLNETACIAYLKARGYKVMKPTYQEV